jgi:hypothetical protein
MNSYTPMMNSCTYEFIVVEYEFIYACIWIHIYYEFIYLWLGIHVPNYEFIVTVHTISELCVYMNSYLLWIHIPMNSCSKLWIHSHSGCPHYQWIHTGMIPSTKNPDARAFRAAKNQRLGTWTCTMLQLVCSEWVFGTALAASVARPGAGARGPLPGPGNSSWNSSSVLSTGTVIIT